MINWHPYDPADPSTWPPYDHAVLVFGTISPKMPPYVQFASLTKHKMKWAPPFFLSPMGEYVTHWAEYTDINLPQ